MSFGDVEERPTKKRRFFVDDSPIVDQTLTAEPSLPDEINALPEILASNVVDGGAGSAVEDGFDADLLSSFVGEQLPAPTVERLRELSGNSIERGVHKFSLSTVGLTEI
jgi:DNA repair protein RAD5